MSRASPGKKNRRSRRPRSRARRRRDALLRRQAPWLLALVALATLVLVLRRACPPQGSDRGYRQRALSYRPLTFEPRRAPTHIRVLRTAQPYRMAVCAADYRGHCVQRLELERYVAGVVMGEEGVFRKRATTTGRLDAKRLARVGQAWQLQAIAARTYGLYAVLADKYYVRSSGFHLTDTPRDQVYTDRRDSAIDRAVRATRGQVLVDGRGRLIHAEYSASCRSLGTRDVVRRHQHIQCHPRCKEFAFAKSSHHRGMCQWGSYLHAMEGRSIRWLLRRYYPNAGLLRLR